MRIAVLQFDPRFGEVRANVEAVERLMAGHKADVWVLPELFTSGYLFTSKDELLELAEPVNGPTFETMRRWASEHDAAICGGWPERSGDRLYNSAMIVTPEGLLSHYRKVHLFHREKLYFRGGDIRFDVAEYKGAWLGMMICFDWRFPESARSLALAGADVILHPSNLVMDICPAAMVTRALENGVFIATSDRIGMEDRGGQRFDYHGSSQIVSPHGEILGRLDSESDGVLVVEIDPFDARSKQVTEHNHLLKDRRTELYRD